MKGKKKIESVYYSGKHPVQIVRLINDFEEIYDDVLNFQLFEMF